MVANEAPKPVRVHGLGQMKVEARAQRLAVIFGLPVAGERDEAQVPGMRALAKRLSPGQRAAGLRHRATRLS